MTSFARGRAEVPDAGRMLAMEHRLGSALEKEAAPSGCYALVGGLAQRTLVQRPLVVR